MIVQIVNIFLMNMLSYEMNLYKFISYESVREYYLDHIRGTNHFS